VCGAQNEQQRVVSLSALQQVARGNVGVKYTNEPSDAFLATRLEYEMAFAHHNLKAGCGVPLVYKYRDLGECLASPVGHIELGSLAFGLLKKWRDTPHSSVKVMTPQELVDNGLALPSSVMIKQEPHPKRKFVEGRFRLVVRVAAPSIMGERVLYGPLAQANLERWETQPAKPGMGSTDYDNAVIWHSVAIHTEVEGGVSDDVKCWDGTTPLEIHELNDDLLVALTDADALWENMIRNCEHAMRNKVYVLSDGTAFALDVAKFGSPQGAYIVRDGKVEFSPTPDPKDMCAPPAKQTSGRLLTAFNNSNMRSLLNFITSPLETHERVWGIYMGDDSVHSVHSRVSEFERLGMCVTDRKPFSHGGSFDFCSHLFVGGAVAVPSNWGKALYNLMSKPFERAHLDQFYSEMRWIGSLPEGAISMASFVAVLIWSGWFRPPTSTTPAKRVWGGLKHTTFCFEHGGFS